MNGKERKRLSNRHKEREQGQNEKRSQRCNSKRERERERDRDSERERQINGKRAKERERKGERGGGNTHFVSVLFLPIHGGTKDPTKNKKGERQRGFSDLFAFLSHMAVGS